MTQADLDAARAAKAAAEEEWEGARRLFASALAPESETPAHIVAEYRRAVRLAARDLDAATAKVALVLGTISKAEADLAARRFVRDLRENADAYHVGTIDRDTFSARNHVIWRAIDAAGPVVRRFVTNALRESLVEYPEAETGARS